MILSKSDYRYYILADRIAKGMPAKFTPKDFLRNILFPNHIWLFQKQLRKLEYYTNCKKGLLFSFRRIQIRRKFNKLSLKLGFSIPPNVFGPGLSIAHYGTIIVNSGAKVGENCRLHACVNIGTEAGYADKAPQIGNNCYIGPGVKMFGAIQIANGTAIGANAVVTKSSLEENIVLAGVPAKKIAETDTKKMLIPATMLIQSVNNIEKLSVGEIKVIIKELRNFAD